MRGGGVSRLFGPDREGIAQGNMRRVAGSTPQTPVARSRRFAAGQSIGDDRTHANVARNGTVIDVTVES
jgi:hypothetical protein